MGFEVRAHYSQLDQVATSFNNQSEAIAEMLQRVRGSMEALEGGGWIGEGAESFYREMHDGVLPSVERLRQALDRAGVVTRQISHKLHQAETDAAAYFRV